MATPETNTPLLEEISSLNNSADACIADKNNVYFEATQQCMTLKEKILNNPPILAKQNAEEKSIPLTAPPNILASLQNFLQNFSNLSEHQKNIAQEKVAQFGLQKEFPEFAENFVETQNTKTENIDFPVSETSPTDISLLELPEVEIPKTENLVPEQTSAQPNYNYYQNPVVWDPKQLSNGEPQQIFVETNDPKEGDGYFSAPREENFVADYPTDNYANFQNTAKQWAENQNHTDYTAPNTTSFYEYGTTLSPQPVGIQPVQAPTIQQIQSPTVLDQQPNNIVVPEKNSAPKSEDKLAEFRAETHSDHVMPENLPATPVNTGIDMKTGKIIPPVKIMPDVEIVVPEKNSVAQKIQNLKEKKEIQLSKELQQGSEIVAKIKQEYAGINTSISTRANASAKDFSKGELESVQVKDQLTGARFQEFIQKIEKALQDAGFFTDITVINNNNIYIYWKSQKILDFEQQIEALEKQQTAEAEENFETWVEDWLSESPDYVRHFYENDIAKFQSRAEEVFNQGGDPAELTALAGYIATSNY